MVLQPPELAAPARQDGGDPPDPRAVRLTERVGDPRPDADMALAGVVEQPGEQDLVVGHAVGAQRRHDVEPVASIGDVHRVEERELRRGVSQVDECRPLVDPHPGGDVRAELADLSGPPRSPGKH